jgi:hypothetical protein
MKRTTTTPDERSVDGEKLPFPKKEKKKKKGKEKIRDGNSIVLFFFNVGGAGQSATNQAGRLISRKILQHASL